MSSASTLVERAIYHGTGRWPRQRGLNPAALPDPLLFFREVFVLSAIKTRPSPPIGDRASIALLIAVVGVAVPMVACAAPAPSIGRTQCQRTTLCWSIVAAGRAGIGSGQAMRQMASGVPPAAPGDKSRRFYAASFYPEGGGLNRLGAASGEERARGG